MVPGDPSVRALSMAPGPRLLPVWLDLRPAGVSRANALLACTAEPCLLRRHRTYRDVSSRQRVRSPIAHCGEATPSRVYSAAGPMISLPDEKSSGARCRDGRQRGPSSAWSCGCVGIGNRPAVWQAAAYPSVLAFDFNLRTAFIDGIARHGLPAVNPVFFPGHSVLLRYHYFWFIPIALVDRLGGALVTARHALTGGNVWCGWAMMAIVALYLRFFHPQAREDSTAGSNGRLGLLVVAGLDVLPNLFWTSPITSPAFGLLIRPPNGGTTR